MFASVALARRIESAECRLIRAGAESIRARSGGDGVLICEIGGGLAVFTSPGDPWNKVAGLGFEPLDPAALAVVEDELRRRGAPVQVEFPILGDNTQCAMLTRRGYVLVGFENVLGLELARSRPRDLPTDVVVDPAATTEAAAWIDAVITGFEHPDPSEGPQPLDSFPRELLTRVMTDFWTTPGFRPYFARIDGTVVGGGGLCVAEGGVAQLTGAATLPAWRRRGVQTALLHARLAAAERAGAEVAVITTQPGSRSQANTHRQGFTLLYTRAILVRSWGE